MFTTSSAHGNPGSRGFAGSPPAALVLGLGVHGLAIARSLGRRGITVDVMDTDSRQPHRLSRYCHRMLHVESLDDDRLIESLVHLGNHARGRTALFITRDRTVPLISAHRDTLARYYDFTLPPHCVVLDLMHKARLTAFLDRAGTRYPRTAPVPRADALPAAGDVVGFPCVLKPALRSARFKASKARSPAELAAAYDEGRRSCDELIVQEWIPGPDANVYFAFAYLGRDGSAQAVFTGHKLHQHPPGTGIASEAAACSDEFVTEETLRLFRLAEYRGFGSSEFRRHPETGDYYLIEFTVGRTDYNVACAVANGVDLPWIGYRDTVGFGASSPPPQQRSGRRWVDSGRNVKAIMEEARAVGASRWKSVPGILRCFHPRNAFTLFQFTDPAPLLGHAAARVRSAILAIPRRVARVAVRAARHSMRGNH